MSPIMKTFFCIWCSTVQDAYYETFVAPRMRRVSATHYMCLDYVAEMNAMLYYKEW